MRKVLYSRIALTVLLMTALFATHTGRVLAASTVNKVKDLTIVMTATVNSATPSISLSFDKPSTALDTDVFTISRNGVQVFSGAWNTQPFVDNTVAVGTPYEYTITGGGATGHLYSGINIPAVTTSKGTVLLLSDQTMDGSLPVNTTLAAAVAKGATTLTLPSALGIEKQMSLAIDTGASTESVTVTAYNAGTQTVTFSPALAMVHVAGPSAICSYCAP